MNDNIIEALKAERNRIDAAIAALSGSRASSTNGRRGPRTMSADARARIAAAQRKRWAKIRKAKKN